MEFVQAKWFRQRGNLPVTRIVVHDMEFPEKPDAAEAVAQIFHRGRVDANGKPIKSSAHYCVDDNTIVRCVLDEDGAYHAPPNQHSIGIEHAGYARQMTGEWLDAYGVAMLRDQSAPLVRGLCNKYGVPKRWLTVEQVRAGWHGVTSHNNVSLAFHQSDHTDPGPNFPVAQYMEWVIGPPPLPTPEIPDMPFPVILLPADDAGHPIPGMAAEFIDSNDTWRKIASGEERDQLETIAGPPIPAKDFVRDFLKASRKEVPR